MRAAAVYRLYGADGELLYVGKTTHLKRRFAQHRARSSWFGLVDRVELEVLEGAIASRAEWVAIGTLAPLFNKVGNHRRGWHYPLGNVGIAYSPDRDEVGQPA